MNQFVGIPRYSVDPRIQGILERGLDFGPGDPRIPIFCHEEMEVLGEIYVDIRKTSLSKIKQIRHVLNYWLYIYIYFFFNMDLLKSVALFRILFCDRL